MHRGETVHWSMKHSLIIEHWQTRPLVGAKKVKDPRGQKGKALPCAVGGALRIVEEVGIGGNTVHFTRGEEALLSRHQRRSQRGTPHTFAGAMAPIGPPSPTTPHLLHTVACLPPCRSGYRKPKHMPCHTCFRYASSSTSCRNNELVRSVACLAWRAMRGKRKEGGGEVRKGGALPRRSASTCR